MPPRLPGQQHKCPVCRCLARPTRHGRRHSSLPSAPPASGYSPIPGRSLLQITGVDATKFLHGLVTSTVPPSASNPIQMGFYTAFLNAPGRLQHDVFIYPFSGISVPPKAAISSGVVDGLATVPHSGEGEGGYVLEVDATAAQGLAVHLRRHRLRSKVDVRAIEPDQLSVVSVWQAEDHWTAHPLHGSAAGSEVRAALGTGTLLALDQRAPGLGTRVLLRPGEEQRLDGVPGLERCGPEQVRLRRYLRGVPEGWAEMGEGQALAMNVNLDVMGGVDFKKGCYVGQELTIRTHHTGVVRRRVLPVMLYDGDDDPDKIKYDPTWSGGPVRRDSEMGVEGKRGKPGKIIGSMGNVGLAMARLEMMTDLAVTNEPSSYDADDKFVVELEDRRTVRVKAFVPDWLRGKIRAPKVQKRVDV